MYCELLRKSNILYLCNRIHYVLPNRLFYILCLWKRIHDTGIYDTKISILFMKLNKLILTILGNR